MESRLLARHALEALDERIDGLTCVTVQFGRQPAFFVELVGSLVGSHNDQRRRLHGVIATDGVTELIAPRDATLDWALLRGRKSWFDTIDLDGDGTDDVIVHRGDPRDPDAEWLDVIVVRRSGLVELKGLQLSYNDPEIEQTCHGVLATEKVGSATHLVVTTTGSTGASEHCLSSGRHVFAMQAEKLVELPNR